MFASDGDSKTPTVDILILGAGWLSTFLIPLCTRRSITFTATTRSGRDGTIPFTFDHDTTSLAPYNVLPDARTVLITFPILKQGGCERLVKLYQESRKSDLIRTGFILLGSVGIWDVRRGVFPSRIGL